MSTFPLSELTAANIGAPISFDTSTGTVAGTLTGFGWGGDVRDSTPPKASIMLYKQAEVKGLPLDTIITILDED